MTEPGVPAPAETGTEAAGSDPGPPAASTPDTTDNAVTGAEAPSPVVSPRRSALLMAAVAVGVVVLDQLTKTWALRTLDDRDEIRVVGSLLRFTLTFNKGMAFSRGTGLGPVIGVVAVVVIVVLLMSLRRESSRLARVALSCVIGGAIGNILDRLFRAGDGGFMGGAVVDFIQLPRWPVFNIADMAVTLGGVALVLGAWRSGKGAPSGPPAPGP